MSEKYENKTLVVGWQTYEEKQLQLDRLECLGWEVTSCSDERGSSSQSSLTLRRDCTAAAYKTQVEIEKRIDALTMMGKDFAEAQYSDYRDLVRKTRGKRLVCNVLFILSLGLFILAVAAIVGALASGKNKYLTFSIVSAVAGGILFYFFSELRKSLKKDMLMPDYRVDAVIKEIENLYAQARKLLPKTTADKLNVLSSERELAAKVQERSREEYLQTVKAQRAQVGGTGLKTDARAETDAQPATKRAKPKKAAKTKNEASGEDVPEKLDR